MMMNKRRKSRYRKWLFVIGTLFILAACAVYLFNQYEDYLAAKRAQTLLEEIHTVVPGLQSWDEDPKGFEEKPVKQEYYAEQLIPDYILNPDMKMPEIEIDGNLFIGTLYFPALDLELPVMNSWSYPGLRISPCLYSGSVYKGSVVIAAHNYISHFGRLSDLSPGDTVMFIDAAGNMFIYEIAVQEVLAPTAIDEMVESSFDLSLFTCTIGGTSRFTVRCILCDAIPNEL